MKGGSVHLEIYLQLDLIDLCDNDNLRVKE